MKLMLDFGLLSIESPQSLALGEKGSMAALIQNFQDIEMFKSLRYFGVEGEQKKSFSNSDDLLKVFKNPKFLPYAITDKPGSGEESIKVRFSFRKAVLLLKVIKEASITNLSSDTDGLIEVFERFQNHFTQKIQFDLVASVLSLEEVQYQKSSNSKIWGKFNQDSLIDFIHPDKVEFSEEIIITDNLCKASLPRGVKRKCTKDFCVINWVNGITNEKELAERLSIRFKWYEEHSEFPQDTNFNEFGDELFSIPDAIATPYLTFYNKFDQTGYKASVLKPNKQFDKSLFDELKEWLASGKTPDGKSISRINLILPNREDALAVKKKAEQYGFGLVLYPSDDGNLWKVE